MEVLCIFVRPPPCRCTALPLLISGGELEYCPIRRWATSQAATDENDRQPKILITEVAWDLTKIPLKEPVFHNEDNHA